jgi:hypothetical protein
MAVYRDWSDGMIWSTEVGKNGFSPTAFEGSRLQPTL